MQDAGTKIRQRLSNIEFLRIISMLLILAHHFSYFGFYHFASNNLLTPFNNIFSAILGNHGKLGVALFVLITGYFMIDSLPKLKHGLYLYFQTWFYSMLFLGLYLLKTHNLPSEIVKNSVFPFIHHAYWFITAYLTLYILIPFINKGFKFIYDKHYERCFFIIFTGIFLFIHTEILDFTYLYCLGGFIKKRTFPFDKLKLKHYKLGIVILFVWLIYYTTINMYHSNPVNSEHIMHKMMTIHSPYILLLSICIFNIFKNLDFGVNKNINSISKNVLGVYLIHENTIFRLFLWKHVFSVLNIINPVFYPLMACLVILTLFCFFILADKILSKFYKLIPDLIIHTPIWIRRAIIPDDYTKFINFVGTLTIHPLLRILIYDLQAIILQVLFAWNRLSDTQYRFYISVIGVFKSR